MKTIYILSYDNNIHNSKYFSELEKAQKELKNIKKDRKIKPGVYVVTDSELVFSFTLGWQETQVTYSIKEFKVD